MTKLDILETPTRFNDYRQNTTVPPRPFDAAWESIPEIVRVSMMPLSGIQPITKKMIEVADGVLKTKPSEKEVEIFRQYGTKFQMITLVMTMAYWQEIDGLILGTPCSIHALPSVKRGKVQYCDIDTVASVAEIASDAGGEDVLSDFNPFSGEYSMSIRNGDYVAWSRQKRPLSSIGFVLERYFLVDKFDREDVTEFDAFIPNEHKKAYKRNRIKKLVL
jgi:hypothetical protein